MKRLTFPNWADDTLATASVDTSTMSHFSSVHEYSSQYTSLFWGLTHGNTEIFLEVSSVLENRAVTLPHGVLEQLGQDVVQGEGDEGEVGRHVAAAPHSGGAIALVLAHTPAGGKTHRGLSEDAYK